MGAPHPADWAPLLATEAPPLADARDVHVWLLRLDDPPLSHARALDILSDAERARAARLQAGDERRRFETARALMRLLLAPYAGEAPAAIGFTIGEHGKPRLAERSGARGVSFNASHSGAYAMIGVTLDRPIGVDIEVRSHVSDYRSIARERFAAEEEHELLRLAPTRRQEGFLACWTRKEAYLKATGGGLHLPLHGFVVSVDPDRPAVLRSIAGSEEAAHAWSLWSGRPTADTFSAVAVQQIDARLSTFTLARPPESREKRIGRG